MAKKSHESKNFVAKRSAIVLGFLDRLLGTIKRRTRMIINLKDAAWKEESLKIHALLEQELSMGLDRVWAKTMGYQRALQIIGKLNAFINTEASNGSYRRRHKELLEICAELHIRESLIQKIKEQFGAECFFVPTLNPKISKASLPEREHL
jgi:hypothetical protein